MKKSLEEIEKLISKKEFNIERVRAVQINFIKNELRGQHCVDKYIGDFPTFIEPVHLGSNIKIGDDVLIGPNVYIGDNCEIGDYGIIMNTIIFNNVKLGENFKLENCIIARDSKLTFNNFKAFSCILMGDAYTVKNLKKIPF